MPDTLQLKRVAAGTATTVICDAPGFLNSITINTKGASSNTLTGYDNASAASGTVLFLINTTVDPGTFSYQGQFKNGLTIASATGTGCDYTVSFSN